MVPFTSEEYNKSWFKKLTAEKPVPLSVTHVRNMNLSTVLALGRINPDLAKEHLLFIVEAIGLHHDPVDFLIGATAHSFLSSMEWVNLRASRMTGSKTSACLMKPRSLG